MEIKLFFKIIFVATTLFYNVSCLGEILWAVNCGGDSHTDIQGITYERDTLSIGTSSDYGKSLNIHRVHPRDEVLYQTERYHTETFGYEIPLKKDGDYVLVLKFSEVWFTASGLKVFTLAAV